MYLKDGPLKEGDAPAAPPNPLTDPGAMDGMMAGMKTQMVMMVPQMVIMGWINFFFQGFVLSEYKQMSAEHQLTSFVSYSQTAISIDARIQIYAPTWY